MTKLLSVAIPVSMRQKANSGKPDVNTVATFPTSEIMLARMRIGSRPMWSDIIPSPRDPRTEPTKNMDWASAGFQLSSQTQFNCNLFSIFKTLNK